MRGTPDTDRAGSLYPVSQENLEGRVSALETTVEGINRRLRVAEQDAAAARVLAGAADRDVTEIRAEIRDFRNATTASFNALREDFGDLRSHVDRGFAEMRGKLDATASGQQHIADLIQRLIDEQNR
jgi:chromosome segregation ATPase